MGVYLLLILLATIAAIFYFLNLGLNRKAATPDDRNSQKNWAYQALILGGLALFFGGWPFWMTALPIDLYFPWDRFNLAMMFGAGNWFTGTRGFDDSDRPWYAITEARGSRVARSRSEKPRPGGFRDHGSAAS